MAKLPQEALRDVLRNNGRQKLVGVAWELNWLTVQLWLVDAPSRALAARIPRPWQGKFWIQLLVLADPTTPHYYRPRAVVAIPACAYYFGACVFVVCPLR
jgi:hypothetical protein